jgi:hypothetical protein
MELTLSRDELMLIASLFKRDHLAGLEQADPPADPQRARQIAGRSLRARGIAKVENGEPRVHMAALSLVGVCAHAQKTFVVHKLPSNAGATRAVIHVLGEDAVVRETLSPEVYKLKSLKDQAALTQEALALMAATGVPKPAPMTGTLTSDALTAGREAAIKGDLMAARGAFVQGGADAALARALTGFFSAPHQLTLVHAMAASNGVLNVQGMTVATGSAAAWLMLEPAGQQEGARTFTVTAVSTDELRELWGKA